MGTYLTSDHSICNDNKSLVGIWASKVVLCKPQLVGLYRLSHVGLQTLMVVVHVKQSDVVAADAASLSCHYSQAA